MKSLVIGDLTVKYPIVQGGMGVGISLHRLAGAVAKAGGLGVISAAQPGFLKEDFEQAPLDTNIKALAQEIKLAKQAAPDGVIGVNIMVAMNNYKDYVQCCVDNHADIIISGAGLPMDLPKYTQGSDIKIAPIVSSGRACSIILQRWAKRFDRTADMIVIEGPLAGGHLGFKPEEAEQGKDMTQEIAAVLDIAKEYGERYNKNIPVIFGGGVYTREDIDKYLAMGLDGVQMATRFVVTEECDADINFKQAYINAKKEDIIIVKSPVGMPGRAINNKYMQRTKIERDAPDKCYNCITKCNKSEIPYCISKALFNAAKGNVDEALVFCGANAYRVDKMTTVDEIFKELTAE